MALIAFTFNRMWRHINVPLKLMHVRHRIKRNTNHIFRQSISCHSRPGSNCSVRHGISCYVRQPVITSMRQSNLYCKQNLSTNWKVNVQSSFSVICSQSNQDDFVSIMNHPQILTCFRGLHNSAFCASHFKWPGSLLFAQKRNNHILCKGHQSVFFKTTSNINIPVRSDSDLKDGKHKSLLSENVFDEFKGDLNNSSGEDTNKTSSHKAKVREIAVKSNKVPPKRRKEHNIKEKDDSLVEHKYNICETKDKLSISHENSTFVQESESSSASSESDSEIEDFVGGEKEEGQEEVEPPWTSPISLIRGTSGVFELGELMIVLRESNAIEPCVLRLPTEAKLAEYMVIVSGTSVRHIIAIAQEIRKIHKKKKGPGDPHLVIEGMETNDWLAMNLGNIILHIFLPETRAVYDLEMLWTVGEKYDDLCLKQQQESYTMSIDDLPWLKELESSNKDLASKSGKKDDFRRGNQLV